jgi:hypothetical protein
MTLGVHVDEEGFLAESCEARGQVDARGGFSATALLIDNGDDPHGEPSLAMSGGQSVGHRKNLPGGVGALFPTLRSTMGGGKL